MAEVPSPHDVFSGVSARDGLPAICRRFCEYAESRHGDAAVYLLSGKSGRPRRVAGVADTSERGRTALECVLRRVPIPVNGGVFYPLISNGVPIGAVSLRGNGPEIERLAAQLADTLYAANVYAMALHDELTGLPNRRHLLSRLHGEIDAHAAARKPLAFLMLDIDHFKHYNDAYGHPVGDGILRRIAALLRAVPRSFPARVGGEEFALLLPQTPRSEAARAAGRLVATVAGEDFSTRELNLRITVSIGAALYPEHGRNGGEIIDRADTALYRAKRSGKNRFEIT